MGELDPPVLLQKWLGGGRCRGGGVKVLWANSLLFLGPGLGRGSFWAGSYVQEESRQGCRI